jgi:biotin carboxyl carrier protein
MPGTVLAVHVQEGDAVRAGQPLVTVEAMKMEHVVSSPVDGTVGRLLVAAGQSVSLGQSLAEVIGDEAG